MLRNHIFVVHFLHVSIRPKKFQFFQVTFEQLSLQKVTFDCFLSHFSFEQLFEKLQGTCLENLEQLVKSPICSIVPKGTVFKWDREPSGRTGTMKADQLLASLGPGSAVGKKGRKQGQIWSNWKNIGERWPGRPPPFPVSTLPRASLRSPIFVFAHADFFSPSSPNAKPGPRLITSLCRDAPLTSSKKKTQAY